MIIRSLGRKTDLIFARFSGEVVDKGSYTLIRTPSNPDFHWGNYLVFDRAPYVGCLKEWTEIFDREFSFYLEPHHYVFTWDTGREEMGEIQEFLDAGFFADSATVLTASSLKRPPHFNDLISVRPISSDQDWADVMRLQILCADPRFVNNDYSIFKERQMRSYRLMSEAGLGKWFGAFLDGMLVGDLGIFFEDGIGRFQNVGTHPNFRRQGICGSLVYLSGCAALRDFGIHTLVMEADVDYHAARIYESVGFQRDEINHALSWWREKND